MKYFSTFSGIGGFEIGIERAFDEVEQRRRRQAEGELETALPDVISDTQRYKMCGNAVTTNVIQAVFERIFLNSQ